MIIKIQAAPPMLARMEELSSLLFSDLFYSSLVILQDPSLPDFAPPATPGGSVSPPRSNQADILRGDVTPRHISAEEAENERVLMEEDRRARELQQQQQQQVLLQQQQQVLLQQQQAQREYQGVFAVPQAPASQGAPAQYQIQDYSYHHQAGHSRAQVPAPPGQAPAPPNPLVQVHANAQQHQVRAHHQFAEQYNSFQMRQTLHEIHLQQQQPSVAQQRHNLNYASQMRLAPGRMQHQWPVPQQHVPVPSHSHVNLVRQQGQQALPPRHHQVPQQAPAPGYRPIRPRPPPPAYPRPQQQQQPPNAAHAQVPVQRPAHQMRQSHPPSQRHQSSLLVQRLLRAPALAPQRPQAQQAAAPGSSQATSQASLEQYRRELARSEQQLRAAVNDIAAGTTTTNELQTSVWSAFKIFRDACLLFCTDLTSAQRLLLDPLGRVLSGAAGNDVCLAIVAKIISREVQMMAAVDLNTGAHSLAQAVDGLVVRAGEHFGWLHGLDGSSEERLTAAARKHGLLQLTAQQHSQAQGQQAATDSRATAQQQQAQPTQQVASQQHHVEEASTRSSAVLTAVERLRGQSGGDDCVLLSGR